MCNYNNSDYKKERKNMKFAIPTANGKLCQHFGHCEAFIFIEADETTKTVISKEEIIPPEHQPGIIPTWVASNGAKIVIAGGMGTRAQELFKQEGITVITGAMAEDAEKLVVHYLHGTLTTGINGCDHSGCNH